MKNPLWLTALLRSCAKANFLKRGACKVAMSKQIIFAGAISAGMWILFAPSLMAQTDGWRLFNEANQLLNEGQSNDDLKRAVQKYEQALKIFRRTRDAKGEGAALGNLGSVYAIWGQHAKAADYYIQDLAIHRKIGDMEAQGRTLMNLGNIHRDWGQYAKAIEYYEQSLRIKKRAGDAKGEGNTLVNLGIVYSHQGNETMALEYYEKALERYRQAGDLRGQGKVLGNMGLIYAGQDQHIKASEVYEESLAIAEKTKDILSAVNALNNLGSLYQKHAEYSKAVEYYRKSLELAERMGYVQGQWNALFNLARVYDHWGQYAEALRYYEQLLQIKRATGDVKEQCKILDYTGLAHFRSAQYPRAAEYYEKLLEIARKSRDVKTEGQALNQLGNVYLVSAQYPKALEYYNRALEIARIIKDPDGEGNTLGNLGLVYAGQGKYQQATEFYKASLGIAKRTGNHQAEAHALANLGDVHTSRGEYAAAVASYEKVLVIFRKIKDVKGEAKALAHLGNIYKDQGRHLKAMESYEKSLAVARTAGTAQEEANVLIQMGNLCLDSDQYTKALDFYQKALKLAKKLGDLKLQSDSLTNLGTVYDAWRQYSNAVASYENALALARKTGDRSGEGITLNHLGNVYQHWGRNTEAMKLYEMSLGLARETQNIEGEGIALTNIGNIYLALSQYSRAVEFYEKGLLICRNQGDLKGEGKDLNNLGTVFLEMGHYALAWENYEKSLSIKRKIGDLKGEGKTLGNLGNVYSALHRYPEAIQAYEKSLEITKKTEDVGAQATALGNLAIIYLHLGRYAKAVEKFLEAKEIHKNIGEPHGEGIGWANLGEVYADWGQYSKAADCYGKALEFFKTVGDEKLEANTRMFLGRLNAHMGDHKEAQSCLMAGLTTYRKLGLSVRWPKKLIGDLYLDMGDPYKAEPFLNEAGFDASLGRLLLMKADYIAARTYYGRVLKAAEKSSTVNDLFAAYTGLGLTYEQTGDDSRAAHYYQKAAELTEDLRLGLKGRGQREQFFDVRVEGFLRPTAYKGLARVQLRMNQPMKALNWSEHTKARAFAESFSGPTEGKDPNIPAEILRKDREINERLANLRNSRQRSRTAFRKQNPSFGLFEEMEFPAGKASEGTAVKEILAVRDREIKKLQEELAAHKKVLREKYPLFAATQYPEPMELSQSALKENEWVLEYDVTDSGLLIYLTKGKKVVKALFKPIPQKEVERLVQEFRKTAELTEGEEILEKLKRFDFANAKKLADVLLGDILSDLPEKAPLIIVPDGQLGLIPFETLVLNTGGQVKTDKKIPYVTETEFFGDRNPISYYQSVTALTLARALGNEQKKGARTLAMVDPVFSTDDPRLIKTEAAKRRASLDKITHERLMSFKTELGFTLSRLPRTGQIGESLKNADPSNTDLYQGLEAEKTILFTRDLTPYKYCVFGTHGDMGKALPAIQEPVLFLTLVNQPEGQDGFLRMSEVMGLKLNADMVALTACQSGLGRQLSGEGTMGMGRAFQYAGAKSVLMSLWNVADKSSVMLTEHFFNHLREGKNKLEALRLARDEIRKAGYDHPFFWAPFILVGEVD